MTIRTKSARPSRLFAGLILAGLMGLASCTSVHTETSPNEGVQKKVHWSFKRRAVTLDVYADLDLNLSDKRPHTLVVGIMEFEDPNAFLALVQDPDRAMETLAAGKKRTGILGMWRFIVPPGAHQLLTVDRMHHAKYLGVIAGYSDYSLKKDILLRPFPVTVERSGVIFRSNHYRPAPTFVSIWLGSRHLLGMAIFDHRKKAEKMNRHRSATMKPL
ncbi:MAG: type VI secretion lipoprotein TssJ [Leptospirales bacterium]